MAYNNTYLLAWDDVSHSVYARALNYITANAHYNIMMYHYIDYYTKNTRQSMSEPDY